MAVIREGDIDAADSPDTIYSMTVGDVFEGQVADGFREQDWIEIDVEPGKHYQFDLTVQSSDRLAAANLGLVCVTPSGEIKGITFLYGIGGGSEEGRDHSYRTERIATFLEDYPGSKIYYVAQLGSYGGTANYKLSYKEVGIVETDLTPGATVVGTDGLDWIQVESGEIFGMDGLDILKGGVGSIVHGGGGDDLIDITNGTAYGGDGDDYLKAFRYDGSFMYGGAGNDWLSGSFGDDVLYGGSGDDTIYPNMGNDIVYGGDGNDWVEEGASHGGEYDEFHGGAGDDHLELANSRGTLYGDEGNDRLIGSNTETLMYGGTGNDHLFSGPGWDTMHGGEGNDTFYPGPGDDFIHGGAGYDVVRFDYYVYRDRDEVFINRVGDDILVWVKDESARKTVWTIDGVEALQFVDGTNQVEDLEFDYVELTGSDAGEVLEGTKDSDKIIGGAGDDVISGGGGFDLLTGGAGADRFVFDNRFSIDTVTDFTPGEDLLDLSSIMDEAALVEVTVGDTTTRRLTCYKDTDLESIQLTAVQDGGTVRFDFTLDDHWQYSYEWQARAEGSGLLYLTDTDLADLSVYDILI